MKGWLVVNHFVHTDKFAELFRLLAESAARQNIALEQVTNVELMPRLAGGYLAGEKPDFVLFWDKDVKLCRLIEQQGIRCFNSAQAIALCDDKALTYLSLLKTGIRQPKTILVPKIFHEVDWGTTSFPAEAAEALGLPLVVKECFGSFGAQVYLAHTRAELAAILNNAGLRPAMLQEFVSSSSGHDVRIQVVGGKVAAAMYRYTENDDFRANVTNGAKMRAYTPSEAQNRMALDACTVLGLDFAGVDLLFGEREEPILCEVNSNAHFVNLGKCTGADVGAEIMRYIAEEIRAGRCHPRKGSAAQL